MYVHVCLAIYNYGRKPLSRAAGNGHEAVVKLLLDQGTEVNADCGKGVFDALQAAAYGSHFLARCSVSGTLVALARWCFQLRDLSLHITFEAASNGVVPIMIGLVIAVRQ